MNRQDMINTGLKFVGEMGYIPALSDYKLLQHYPDPKIIKKEFKTWKNYITECNFPFGLSKKINNTIYIGKHSWLNQDYYVDIKNRYMEVYNYLKGLGVKIEIDIIHKQMIFLISYNDKLYAISFLNVYVKDYNNKINSIKESLEDMNIELIDLNKKLQWWKNEINKRLEVEK